MEAELDELRLDRVTEVMLADWDAKQCVWKGMAQDEKAPLKVYSHHTPPGQNRIKVSQSCQLPCARLLAPPTPPHPAPHRIPLPCPPRCPPHVQSPTVDTMEAAAAWRVHLLLAHGTDEQQAALAKMMAPTPVFKHHSLVEVQRVLRAGHAYEEHGKGVCLLGR